MATTADELREEVRRRYAESARAVTEEAASCGCGSGSCCADGESDAAKFGEALYDAEQRGELPEAATLASLGCGNPTAVAELREGEVVLDLGSGGGIDVILSAERVGASGQLRGVGWSKLRENALIRAADVAVTVEHLVKGLRVAADALVAVEDAVVPFGRPATCARRACGLGGQGSKAHPSHAAPIAPFRQARSPRFGRFGGALVP
jgi:hypothetical protein